MNDLISRSALKEVLERYLYAPHVRLGGSMCEGMRMAIKTCIAMLENAHAVDGVPVVRCSSCKYHNKAPCPMRLSLNWTEDNDFCSYGERRTDERD